jgi:hypothetical protein
MAQFIHEGRVPPRIQAMLDADSSLAIKSVPIGPIVNGMAPKEASAAFMGTMKASMSEDDYAELENLTDLLMSQLLKVDVTITESDEHDEHDEEKQVQEPLVVEPAKTPSESA